MNTIGSQMLLAGMALAALPLSAQMHGLVSRGFVSNYGALSSAGVAADSIPAGMVEPSPSSVYAPDQSDSACTFRDRFHVPEPLRKPHEARSWTTLRAGTPVRLRFPEPVSSKQATPGDTVSLEVLDEVQVDGLPVILKQADAWAALQPGTRPPGVHWEWWRYDDRDIQALFGHGGEFPVLRTGGELHLRVQGALDITGGEVPLAVVTKSDGEDANLTGDPAEMVGMTALFAMEGLKRAITKSLRLEPKWSFLSLLNGKNAFFPAGTEITAFVQENICFDKAFLRRVQELKEVTRTANVPAPRHLLPGSCHMSVRPHIVQVEHLRQDENPSCRLLVLHPSEMTDASPRKEMRLVTDEEASIAREVGGLNSRQNAAAGEAALAAGRGYYSEGSESSLRKAITKERAALRHWKAANEFRQYERTLDHLAAAYAALIVRLVEQRDSDAAYRLVAEAVEFDAATSGNLTPRLSGWDSLGRELDLMGGTR